MPWGAVGSIASAVGSLAGAGLSAWSANKINSDNLAFQREVAQNGVRWKVADMRAAGLNPLLSTGINATAPGGGSSVMPDFSGVGASARDIGRMIAEKAAEKADAEIDTIRAQKRNLDTQAAATAANSAATVENLMTSTRKMDADAFKILTEQGLIASNTSKAVAENKAFVDALRNMSPRDRRFYILRKFAPLDAQSGKGISEMQKVLNDYGKQAGSKLGEWWFNFTN